MVRGKEAVILKRFYQCTWRPESTSTRKLFFPNYRCRVCCWTGWSWLFLAFCWLSGYLSDAQQAVLDVTLKRMATHQKQYREAGRNANPCKERKTHPRDPQDEGAESSKSMETRGESGEETSCDLAARRNIPWRGKEMTVSLSTYPRSFMGAPESTL